MANTFIVINENNEKQENPKIKGLEVRFLGDNSSVILHAPLPTFLNCIISMGDDAIFEIESSPYKVKNLVVSRMKNKCCVKIGKNFSCESLEIPMHGETNCKVIIGDDCMFSHGISIYTSDFHGIYDLNTMKPINYGGDIIIGNHVWLGANITIMKKSVICDNCVVGTQSVIAKRFDKSNCIIAGVPAKIIKEGINWCRDNCQYLEKRGIL